MTSDFEGFSIPDCIHYIYSYNINSWERASIFFECSVLNRGSTGTIFITSLVWRGPWIWIEPGTSRTRIQHYTTRLSRRRSSSIKSLIEISMTPLPFFHENHFFTHFGIFMCIVLLTFSVQIHCRKHISKIPFTSTLRRGVCVEPQVSIEVFMLFVLHVRKGLPRFSCATSMHTIDGEKYSNVIIVRLFIRLWICLTIIGCWRYSKARSFTCNNVTYWPLYYVNSLALSFLTSNSYCSA